jgi:CheY-like chemotaxis protein
MVILLVEDQETDVMLLQRAFANVGAQSLLRSVADGDAAIAYLSGEGIYADRHRHPLPDLVLLDLKLPRRSGFEVLDWVRKHSALHRLPTVMLTSSREAADINQAYDLGANSYLAKPVAFDDLLELARVVNRYWGEWSERPELPATG